MTDYKRNTAYIFIVVASGKPEIPSADRERAPIIKCSTKCLIVIDVTH